MPLSLAAITGPALADWLKSDRRSYIDERVAAGEDLTTATKVATEQQERLFPNGEAAPGQFVYRVINDGEPVGMLWIGESIDDRPGLWWVFKVEIAEQYRGQGLGRAAMRLAEEQARRSGATSLGLNVFGHNRIARHLYESLGYKPTSIRMEKPLQP